MNRSVKTQILDCFRALFKIPALESFLAKRTQGKTIGGFWTKLIPNNYQYAEGSWRTTTRNDINLRLDLHEYVDWWIYFGIHEEERDHLYNLLKPGMCVLDIGANIGETTLNFAKRVGPEGEVHGFEPDRINFEKFAANVKLNSYPNICVNNFGLGDKPGNFSLQEIYPHNKGSFRIAPANENSSGNVKIITPDEYAASRKLRNIDLMKLDVEGYEMNVLIGSKYILEHFRPLLFVELDDENLKLQGHDARSVISFLIKAGYKIQHARTLETVTESNDFRKCHFDIICKPQ